SAYPGSYPFVRATYSDMVVYELDGAVGPGLPSGIYRVTYAIDPEDGDVEFGIPEEVTLAQVVVPVEPDGDGDRLDVALLDLEVDALDLEAAALLG
ncbi:MAG: hypothetical protein M3N98_03215, partial [Actinomycetota bacterium]|nr:hypothetical protein [Actinomycetota bacterium]